MTRVRQVETEVCAAVQVAGNDQGSDALSHVLGAIQGHTPCHAQVFRIVARGAVNWMATMQSSESPRLLGSQWQTVGRLGLVSLVTLLVPELYLGCPSRGAALCGPITSSLLLRIANTAVCSKKFNLQPSLPPNWPPRSHVRRLCGVG